MLRLNSYFSIATVFCLTAIGFGSDIFAKQALANSERPTHEVTQVRGRVQFKDYSSSNYRTASIGIKLYPGYLLRLGAGAMVEVKCDSGSGRTLTGSGTRGVNEICLTRWERLQGSPRSIGKSGSR